MESKGKIVVISGPSGAGKSSITHEVVRRTGARFSVSVTTRKPREGELDGRDYRFVDRGTFQQMIDDDKLLEHAEVFGELYGTPRAEVEEALSGGETILLEVDVQGGRQVKETLPEATFVLIVPPGEGELARRLRGRGSEDEAELTARLALAESEVAAATAGGAYNHVIVNDELERAIDQLVEIVQE